MYHFVVHEIFGGEPNEATMQPFIQALADQLASNPLAELKPPANGKPRHRRLSPAEAGRVEAALAREAPQPCNASVGAFLRVTSVGGKKIQQIIDATIICSGSSVY